MEVFVGQVVYTEDYIVTAIVKRIPHSPECYSRFGAVHFTDTSLGCFTIAPGFPTGECMRVEPIREIQITEEDTVPTKTTILDIILNSKLDA